MIKVLFIDDASCKKELAAFVKKHKRSVRLLIDQEELNNKADSISNVRRKLAVNTTESVTLLNINEIVRCESNRNYTFIYMCDGKKLIVSKTLMEFEEVLSRYSFLRIHKSHLVNINYLEKYMKSEGGFVVLTDGTRLPVAIRKKEYLFRELERL